MSNFDLKLQVFFKFFEFFFQKKIFILLYYDFNLNISPKYVNFKSFQIIDQVFFFFFGLKTLIQCLNSVLHYFFYSLDSF